MYDVKESFLTEDWKNYRFNLLLFIVERQRTSYIYRLVWCIVCSYFDNQELEGNLISKNILVYSFLRIWKERKHEVQMILALQKFNIRFLHFDIVCWKWDIFITSRKENRKEKRKEEKIKYTVKNEQSQKSDSYTNIYVFAIPSAILAERRRQNSRELWKSSVTSYRCF